MEAHASKGINIMINKNMNTTLLLSILLCALSTGVIAFITLLSKKKDDNRFEKITAIATFLTSITTIVVGIATISVAKHQEDIERLQNQPLYSVSIKPQWSSEKGQNINEEYIVVNEGKKAKNKTAVSNYTFLEIIYSDLSESSKSVTKIIPYDHYFGANVHTNNLDGTIQYSYYSGNNLERFGELYKETIKYGKEHPRISVNIRKIHYFVIEYTDIYGDNHRIVKTEESETDPEKLDEVIAQAEKDSGEKHIDADNPNTSLNSIIETYFSN